MDKSKRKPNFTDTELKYLLREIQQRQDLVTNLTVDDNSLSKKEIRDVWLEIEKSFEAISTSERTADELRNKYFDFKSRTKKKVIQIKQSGATHRNLTENEKLVLNLTSENASNGMFEFVDTFDAEIPATSSQHSESSPISSPLPSPISTPLPSPTKRSLSIKQHLSSPSPAPPSPPPPQIQQTKRKRDPIVIFARTKRKISDDKDEKFLEIARRQAEATEKSNVFAEQRNALLAELIDVLKTKFA